MMLAGGSDPFYREILAASHQTYDRVEVWDDTGRLAVLEMAPADPLDFMDAITERRPMLLPGSGLRATLANAVARSCNLVLPFYMYPWDTEDLFSPHGNEIRAYSGVRLPTGELDYVWQSFRGKIQDTPGDTAAATFNVIASDPAQEVIDNDFVTPQNSLAGAPVTEAAQVLILDAVPTARFGPSDDIPATVPALAWEFNRSGAIEEMMRSNGALWYCLHDGNFTFRRYQWTQPGPPVVVYRDGPGGTMLSARPNRSRSDVFNVVAATSQQLNGNDPVYALEQDDNPASPTWVGGKFGQRSKLMRLATPYTQGGIQQAALAQLRASITPTMTFGWDMVRDCALELGDITGLLLTEVGRQFVQVVSGFSYQFGVGAMSVSGRAQVLQEVDAA